MPTTTDLVPVESPMMNTLAIADQAWPMIERICKASTLSPAYRNKPEEALAAVLTGVPLGLDLMQCLQEIHVIQGTPALSAKAQRGIVQRAGHKMWLVESSSTKVVMRGHRAGEPEHVQEVTWTIDRARQMGLVNKDNWKKQPETMMIARASGDMSRLLGADALLGLAYNVDEVADGAVDEEWAADGDLATVAPVDAAKPAARTTKRSAKAGSQRKAAAARPPAPVAGEPPLPPLPGEADPPAAEGRDFEHRLSDAMRIRTEEVLGELERDDRLAFWSASAQREIGSGLELTQDDANLITIDLDLIVAGEQAWLGGKLVDTETAEVVDDGVASPADGPDGEAGGGNDYGNGEFAWSAVEWKACRESVGMSNADMIRAAAKLAGEMGEPPPTSAAAIAEMGGEFQVALRARIEAAS